jgi:hypothetical protein
MEFLSVAPQTAALGDDRGQVLRGKLAAGSQRTQGHHKIVGGQRALLAGAARLLAERLA